ncbi:MAG: DUF58 domain-containing protein [Burkholderiales bacterium]|nr:DUF58 domain-containing protein [Burkholderiales bacterium]
MTPFFDAEFLRKLERLRLRARRIEWAGVKGEHAASRKGHSLEFSDYRRYQRGDDLRYVDWNIYRRLDRLLLKVFTAEEEMNIYLLVDASGSMDATGALPASGAAKIDYAKKVAAAIGYVGLRNHDRVGGAAFAAALQSPLKPGRGRAHILRLFAFLAGLPCGGPTDLAAAIRRFTAVFPRPGLAVLVSDLLDPPGWRAAVEELARRRHQVLVIHVLDEAEIEPAVAGDLSLVDAESGRERRLFVDAALARRYREQMARYLGEIESACANLGIDYLRTTTRVAFDDFVLKALRQAASVS